MIGKAENTFPTIISFICIAIFLLFAFDYSLSTFIFPHILPYDQKRLLELSLLASAPFLSYLFFQYSETLVDIFHSMKLASKIALMSFVFLGFISCLFAKIPEAALLEWSLFVLLVFYSVFWCAVGLHVGRIFFFYNALIGFFAAAVYAFPLSKSYLYCIHHNLPINFFPYFINPRFFAQFALWTLPLLPLADYWIRSKRSLFIFRILFFVLGSFWWALTLVNGSRGLLLSFSLASLFGLILFRKALIPWLWREILYIVSAVILIFIFIGALPSWENHKISSGNSSTLQTINNISNNISHIHTLNSKTINPRLFLYEDAWDLAKTHPLLGVGPMHFAYAPTREMENTHIFHAHPHNFPLLIISEWGIPAGLALGIFIVILLRNFYQARSKLSENLIMPCYSISLLAGLLYSLVSGVTVMPLSQIMGAIIAGNCLAIYFQNKLTFSPAKKTPYHMVIGTLLGFALLIVSVNVIPKLSHLTESEALWFQAHQNDIGVFVPRFWLQGFLTDHQQITKHLK